MSAKMFTGDQKIKLTALINEGMVVLHEIDTLREGLSETVKILFAVVAVPLKFPVNVVALTVLLNVVTPFIAIVLFKMSMP